jgi:hypothetical protein
VGGFESKTVVAVRESCRPLSVARNSERKRAHLAYGYGKISSMVGDEAPSPQLLEDDEASAGLQQIGRFSN